jgi:hypothetical protein
MKRRIAQRAEENPVTPTPDAFRGPVTKTIAIQLAAKQFFINRIRLKSFAGKIPGFYFVSVLGTLILPLGRKRLCGC